MEETNKKTTNEALWSKLEKVENKLDLLIEGEAVIMNAIGSMILMSETKEEDRYMKNGIIENLIQYRDACMKEIHGEEYEELMKVMNGAVDSLKDILDRIFK